MLDLRQYNCLGEALRAALDRWPDEICLIEADRDRENARLTYRQFKETALPLARALQDAGFVKGIARRHHHDESVEMADFGVCDFLLRRRAGSARLQAHARRAFEAAGAFEGRLLVVEYHLWRAITQADGFASLAARVVLVTEAPGRSRSRGREAMGGFSRFAASRSLCRGRAAMRLASSIRREPAGGRKAAS